MDDDRRFLLLANSHAGSVDRRTVGEVLEVLASNGSASLVWTGEPEEVGDAVGGDPDAMPVLVGGDGTLSSGINALVRRGFAGARPIGVIPTGTGNDFARAAGIPLDARRAARAILVGRPRALSLLAVRTHPARRFHRDPEAPPLAPAEPTYGINALHLGVGAAASRRAASWKHHLGAGAYPLAALLTGSVTPAVHVRIEALPSASSGNGAPGANRAEVVFEGPSPMAAFVLGRSIGGGVALADSSLGDDSMDVLVARGTGPIDRLALATALLSSDPGSNRSIHTAEEGRLVVHCERAAPVNLDGEDLGDLCGFEVEVVPAGWSLLCEPRCRADG